MRSFWNCNLWRDGCVWVCVHARALLIMTKYACTWRAQGQQCHWGLLPSVCKTLKYECFICTPLAVQKKQSTPPLLLTAVQQGSLCHGGVQRLLVYARNLHGEDRALCLTASYRTSKNKDLTKTTERDVDTHTFNSSSQQKHTCK